MNDRELNKLKQNIQDCNTTAQVDVVIKEHGLSDIEGLPQHIKELYKKGEISNLKGSDVNNFINQQNYKNIAEQAHGFLGVKKAIDEYKKGLKETDFDIGKFIEAIKQSNSSLGEFLEGLDGAEGGLLDYAGSLATATLKSAAMEAITAGLNAFISALISFAVSSVATAAIKFVDDLTESFEEQKEKLDEAKNSILDYESQISELESKLSENEQKIRDINANPLSIVDKNTLSTLEKENTQLKQQLDLVKSLNESAKELASDITVQILNNTAETIGLTKSLDAFGEGDLIGGLAGSDNSIGGLINAFDKFKEGDGSGALESLLKGIFSVNPNIPLILCNFLVPQKENEYSPTEEAHKQIEEIKSLYDDLANADNTDDKDTIQSDINEKTTALLNNIKTLQSYKETLDAKDLVQADWISKIQEVEDAYLSMQTKKEDFNTFDEIINSDIYSEDKDKLVELALQGKLTSEAIEENYHNLFVLFEAIGLSADDVIFKLKQMGVEEQRASSATPSSNDSSIYSDKYNKEKQHLIELEGKRRYLKAQKAFYRNDSLNGSTVYEMPFDIDLPEEKLDGEIAEIEKQISKAKKKLQNQLDKESGTVILNAWDMLGENETDENFKKQLLESKEKVLELAEAGQLTVEAFKDSDAGQTILDQTKLSAEEATREINKLVDSSSQLSSLKSGISSIRDAYGEKKEEKLVGADTFAGMEDTFGGLGKSWENYKATLGTASSTLAQCRKAQNDLATAYVNSNNFLSQLTETNKAYYISQLDELGIANPRQVVQDVLNSQKAEEILLNWDIADATRAEVNEKYNEIAALDNCSQAVRNYAMQKAIASKNALSTSKSVANLIALAKQCGYTGQALRKLKELQDLMSERDEFLKTDPTEYGLGRYRTELEKRDKKISKKQEEVNKAANKKPKVKLNPVVDTSKIGNSGKSSKADKKAAKDAKTLFDWIERRITRLTNKISLLNAQKENLFTVKKKNSNLDKQIAATTKLIKTYDAAVTKYSKKASSVKLDDPSLKKLVRNGKIKGSYKKLVQEYGQKKADKIQKYQDWYDKSKSAKQGKAEAIQQKRNLEIEQNQNHVDNYNAKVSLAEAEKENAKSAKEKSKYITAEIDNLEKSYKYQTEIAKLEKDKTKQKQLQAEKEKEINDRKIENLQNYQEETDALLSLNEQREGNATGRKNKNAYVDAQEKNLKTSYDYQKKIAKLNGDTTEEKRLQLEYEQRLIELQQKRIENIKQDYSNQISLVNNDIKDLNNAVDLIEARGQYVNRGYYTAQNKSQEKNLSSLYAERDELAAELKKINKEKQAWYDLQSEIQSVEDAIMDTKSEIADNKKAIQELDKTIADAVSDHITNISDEAEFLAGLLRGDNTDDKTGGFTDTGHAGLYAAGISREASKAKSKYYAEIIAGLEERYKKGDLGDDYNSPEEMDDAINEYRKTWQEAVKAEFDAETEIIDLMKEKYGSQINYLQEIIDAKKELLSEEKELYDYERNIAEKTKSIAAIQKQMAAISGDTSEEGRAKIQKLQSELDEASQNLRDTEYEKYISDQEKMLDSMMEEYRDIVENLEKDTQELLRQGLHYLDQNVQAIDSLVNKNAEEYGYATSRDFQELSKAFEADPFRFDYDKIAGENSLASVIEQQVTRIITVMNGGSPETNTDVTESGNPGTNSAGDGAAYDERLFKQRAETSPDAVPANTPLFSTLSDEYRYLDQAAQNGLASSERDQKEKRALLLNSARSFISVHAKDHKKGKKKKDYSYVNQKIWSATGGKILTGANLKKLAKKTLHIKYDNASEDGALAKKMKEIGYTGFRNGGIGRLVKASGEDGLALVRNGEGFVSPENVEDIRKLFNVVPDISKMLSVKPTLPDITKPKLQSVDFGDVILNLDLPNVTDTDSFVDALGSTRVQKAIGEVVANQMGMGGKLSVNKYRR